MIYNHELFWFDKGLNLMLSYPASAVSTPDGQVNILQITDLHLSSHVPAIADQTSSEVAVCQFSFEAIIKQALS